MTVVAIEHRHFSTISSASSLTGCGEDVSDAEEFASNEAWRSVERQIGAPLRQQLNKIVEELVSLGEAASRLIGQARREPGHVQTAQAAVQTFRRRYAQVDTTLDFIGDAVNSRTSPLLRTALSNLDRLAVAVWRPCLRLQASRSHRFLSIRTRESGASILRAGVRFVGAGRRNASGRNQDREHNLYRPTSLFHETGHQVGASDRLGSIR